MAPEILREMKLCREKWIKTGLLCNLDQEKQGILACLLENQQLYNEISRNSPLNKISLKLTSSVFGKILELDLVDFFPMFGPTATYKDKNYSATTKNFYNVAVDCEITDEKEYNEIVNKITKEIIYHFIYNESSMIECEYGFNLNKKIDEEIEKEKIDWIGMNAKTVVHYLGCNTPKTNFELAGHYSSEKQSNIPIYCLPGIDSGQVILGNKNRVTYGIYIPFKNNNGTATRGCQKSSQKFRSLIPFSRFG